MKQNTYQVTGNYTFSIYTYNRPFVTVSSAKPALGWMVVVERENNYYIEDYKGQPHIGMVKYIVPSE